MEQQTGQTSNLSFNDLPFHIASQIVEHLNLADRFSMGLATKLLRRLDEVVPYRDPGCLSVFVTKTGSIKVTYWRNVAYVDSVNLTFENCEGGTKVNRWHKHVPYNPSQRVPLENEFSTITPDKHFTDLAIQYFNRIASNPGINNVYVSLPKSVYDKIPRLKCSKLNVKVKNVEELEEILAKLAKKELDELEIELTENNSIVPRIPEVVNVKTLMMGGPIEEPTFMSLSAPFIEVDGYGFREPILENFITRWANGGGPRDFTQLIIYNSFIDRFDSIVKKVRCMRFEADMAQLLIYPEDHKELGQYIFAEDCYQIFSEVSTDSATLLKGLYEIILTVTGKVINGEARWSDSEGQEYFEHFKLEDSPLDFDMVIEDLNYIKCDKDIIELNVNTELATFIQRADVVEFIGNGQLEKCSS
ncbi:unnamed protein product [Caenorhabditis bovis]|uniref:F-box domain-containing protein n=1 Tax=Caenorhabditis bovis TaxID=2654633 RepID=A0A8S1FFW8_9PELO|nr:unnamed protein product [Caenorhabditis bovis]